MRAAGELALSGGGQAATIDAIAKRAGVSRTTIYRWWASPAAVLLEGLLDEVRDSIDPMADASARDALAHHVHALTDLLRDTLAGPLLRHVVAAAATDDLVNRALLDHWITPRRRSATSIVQRGIRAGQIDPDVDVDTVVDALCAPAYQRLVLGLSPLTREESHRLFDVVWRGIGIDPDSGPRGGDGQPGSTGVEQVTGRDARALRSGCVCDCG
ncbi:TetR/AcrR family transcriptional regulator [Micromonospora pallida]|uniref:TetR/AcrR family transcriptional regulator n=1 Tax=Micromonospora pallida TaxID=145854 RepID=UPI001C407161|nr:TetR/AcrR family transcriptional regulator [Micromonospora pallida]